MPSRGRNECRFFKMKMSINKPKIKTKICVRIAKLATDQKCLKANGNNCSDVQGKKGKAYCTSSGGMWSNAKDVCSDFVITDSRKRIIY
jgi:hypothetical protein